MEIKDNEIDTDKIIDNAIILEKLAINAVSADKISLSIMKDLVPPSWTILPNIFLHDYRGDGSLEWWTEWI